MSTALTLHRSDTPATVDWPREIEGAKMLLGSGLLPQSIKTPQQALYVILTGRDLGLSPVQSLRSINVIQGKIEVAADMQLALFHRHGGRSHWAELTNERAVLVLTAPWLTEPHTETFTMEDAKRAGLQGDNWRKYPKAMLRSRAITAGMKSAGFDVLAGAYAEGEIGGPEPVVTMEPETVAPAQAVETVDVETGEVVTVEAEPVELPPPVHHPRPEAVATGRTADSKPTEKQAAFFTRLLESSVFTPEERDMAADYLEHRATRENIKAKIDWAKAQVEKRQAKAGSPA